MTNATIATTSSAPIAKLYRMCGKYNAHSACKGAFETHSVCSCPCHKPAAPKAPKAKAQTRKVAAPKPAPKLDANTTWTSVVDAVKQNLARPTAKVAKPAAAPIRADKPQQPKVRLTFVDGTSIELSKVVAVSLV